MTDRGCVCVCVWVYSDRQRFGAAEAGEGAALIQLWTIY